LPAAGGPRFRGNPAKTVEMLSAMVKTLNQIQAFSLKGKFFSSRRVFWIPALSLRDGWCFGVRFYVQLCLRQGFCSKKHEVR